MTLNGMLQILTNGFKLGGNNCHFELALTIMSHFVTSYLLPLAFTS